MTKVALLIGVNYYEETSWQPLPATVRDVQAIAQSLQHPEIGGFEEVNTIELINPDAATIQGALEALFSDRAADDFLLFYFSGYTIPDKQGNLYFVTPKTQKSQLSSTAVSFAFLEELMEKSATQQQVAIIDGCLIRSPGSKKIPGVLKAQLNQMQTTFLTCLSGTQYYLQQKQSEISLYTRYLVEGLETGAADRDNDQQISIAELHEYATARVQIAAPALQPGFYGLPESGKILVAHAIASDAQQKYRLAIESFAHRTGGEISVVTLRTLDILRDRLDLSLSEATEIEVNVLTPYQEYRQKLQQYERVLSELVGHKQKPLVKRSRRKLKHLQDEILALTDADTVPIESRILPLPTDRSFQGFLAGSVLVILAIAGSIYYLLWYISQPTSIVEIISSTEAADSAPTSPPDSTPKAQPVNARHNSVAQFEGNLNPTEQPLTLEGHSDAINAVAISPDNQTLVSGSWDRTIKLWNLDLATRRLTLNGHTSVVRAVAITPDGQKIVSASQDTTIKIWNLATGELLRTLTGHSGPVYAIAISKDGQTLVSGSGDNTLKVWNLSTGELKQTITADSKWVRAVAITPDGQTIVSGGGDKIVKIWNAGTGELIRTLEGHTNLIRGLAISPDGQKIVSASWDRTLKVWDLETGKLEGTLRGHASGVTSVAISPNQIIVSGSDDNTIKLWSLENGQLLGTLTNHEDDLLSVALSRDGHTLAGGSKDQTIKIWQLYR